MERGGGRRQGGGPRCGGVCCRHITKHKLALYAVTWVALLPRLPFFQTFSPFSSSFQTSFFGPKHTFRFLLFSFLLTPIFNNYLLTKKHRQDVVGLTLSPQKKNDVEIRARFVLKWLLCHYFFPPIGRVPTRPRPIYLGARQGR